MTAVPQLKNETFLASAIIINFKTDKDKWCSYLYQAFVIEPVLNSSTFGPLTLLNNYLHIYRTFTCTVCISDAEMHNFQITGSFFCQQNTFTSVCAHAALCMTINNMRSQTNLITTEDINRIIGVDHKSLHFGPNANAVMTDKQLKQVLDHHNLAITIWNFFNDPMTDYSAFVYRYIESRCPVLLVFTTTTEDAHIVPIIGHTLNTDMWKPEAESSYFWQRNPLNYKSSASWVDHFIMHDDNFGMYLCLPVDSLKKTTFPSLDPTFRAYYAAVVLPANVITPAYEAEWASVLIVKEYCEALRKARGSLDQWTERIALSDKIAPQTPVVARTFLATPDDYLKSLDKDDFEGNVFSDQDKQELIDTLPPIFWLSEISLPDLYTANRHKIIDFFYPADVAPMKNTKQIFERWIQIRYPGVLLKKIGDSPVLLNLPVVSHYPMLVLEPQKQSFQW